jgi:hypothetical protein
MFCSQCSNEVEAHARFCSKCGHELAPATVPAATHHDMSMHVNVLGWIYIGCAILTGILGMVIIFGSHVLTRFPIPWPPDMPPGMVPFIGSMVVLAGLLTMLVAGLIAAVGVGLLQYKNWGRILATISAVFMLFSFPIGTAIAVYTYWVLFSEEGRTHYARN